MTTLTLYPALFPREDPSKLDQKIYLKSISLLISLLVLLWSRVMVGIELRTSRLLRGAPTVPNSGNVPALPLPSYVPQNLCYLCPTHVLSTILSVLSCNNNLGSRKSKNNNKGLKKKK